MSTELLDNELPTKKSKEREDLDNVNGVLAAGIVSVVLALFIGGIFSWVTIGLGVYAIIKGKQAMSLHKDYPNDYTVSSYRKAQAGFVCGIIGVSLLAAVLLLTLFILAS